MWFLYLLSWLALLIQICFVTISIAAGLYYLAELIEEYTVATGRVIKYLIWTSCVVYAALYLFEDMPASLIILGLLCNLSYFGILKTFPYIELSSPVFIVSIVMIVINHYWAFSYFADVWHPFHEVLAFFTVCMWLVPFSFFVSLSANDNVLPTYDDHRSQNTDADVVTNYFSKNKKKGFKLLSFFKYAQESLLPERVKKGY